MGIIAKKCTCELKIINPFEISREYLEVLMVNAKGVIAPHGGANYNVLFMKREDRKKCDPNRFFIEFIAKIGGHHTYHIACAARVSYLAIPCEGNHYKKDLIVDPIMLEKSLEKFF
jgi:capsular polysaccharide biosynthesis protein